MEKGTENTSIIVNKDTQEEAHCTKCGCYLADAWRPTYVIIPCSKCKQSNLIDYTGAELIVKRVRKSA